MSTMNLAELKNYENWIGQSPAKILREVIAVGGWVKVFPWGEKFPVWASRLRNYFNIWPRRLRLLDEGVSGILIKKYVNPIYYSMGSDYKARLALSGDVYQDENRWIWLEMAAGGTVYHYGGWSPGKAKAVKATMLSQKHVPVFKLISPDPTGGSAEVCIHNYQTYHGYADVINFKNWFGSPATSGRSRIGSAYKWKNIINHIVIDPRYQGSYNYSETIVKGFDNHEKRDIIPHSHESDFYVDPPRNVGLEARRFPEKDRRGRELAKMI